MVISFPGAHTDAKGLPPHRATSGTWAQKDVADADAPVAVAVANGVRGGDGGEGDGGEGGGGEGGGGEGGGEGAIAQTGTTNCPCRSKTGQYALIWL